MGKSKILLVQACCCCTSSPHERIMIKYLYLPNIVKNGINNFNMNHVWVPGSQERGKLLFYGKL